MKPNYLYKTKFYLAGQIEYATCQNWRERITNELASINAIAFDPLKKPFIDEAPEGKDVHQWLNERRRQRDLQTVKEFITPVRRYDLAMIDRSDAVIVNLNPRIPTFGTIEEMSFAERAMKPTFICIEGGIENTPYWLLAMFDVSCFYDNLTQLMEEIYALDDGRKEINNKYWRLLKKELR